MKKNRQAVLKFFSLIISMSYSLLNPKEMEALMGRRIKGVAVTLMVSSGLHGIVSIDSLELSGKTAAVVDDPRPQGNQIHQYALLLFPARSDQKNDRTA
jgi:hypothetical protein